MTHLPQVSVIIPTLALRERRTCLLSAVGSALDQTQVRPRPIVVVNGASVDVATLAELESDPRIELLRHPHADLPAALRLGRARVNTPWFTSLDDDDLLLPGALARRVAALESHARFDAVVTNGYRRDPQGDALIVPDMQSVARDPLAALTQGNWLLPGSWLCRTSPSTEDLFDAMPRYLECTYLALRFATRPRAMFIDEPTVVWNTDTPASVSKSRAYRLGQEAALRQLLDLDIPAPLRGCFRGRLGEAYHYNAVALQDEGEWGRAWRQHVASLALPGGWRRMRFTWALAARHVRSKVLRP